MDRFLQNGFKRSSQRTRSPSPANGATSTASRTDSPSRANHSFTTNSNGGDYQREPTSQYGAASQPPYAVNYQLPALKISDLLQSPTAVPTGNGNGYSNGNGNGNGNGCGNGYGHEQGDLAIPPLALKKDTEKDTVTVPTEPTKGYPETFKPLEHATGLPSMGSPLTHPNGVSMFPDLSAAEQQELSREALDQAEEAIIADDSADSIGSVHGDDNGSDAGYDSDTASSASTSVMSSVRDYMYENGRRYHRYREGTYNFPNDDVEQEREDMKHAMVKLLCSQKLHFAPIGDNPQEILDIGTGTGIWPIESESSSTLYHALSC